MKDLKKCNNLLRFALENSDSGIHFTSSGLTRDDMIIYTITDASFESERTTVANAYEDSRSQQEYIIALASAYNE